MFSSITFGTSNFVPSRDGEYFDDTNTVGDGDSRFLKIIGGRTQGGGTVPYRRYTLQWEKLRSDLVIGGVTSSRRALVTVQVQHPMHSGFPVTDIITALSNFAALPSDFYTKVYNGAQ